MSESRLQQACVRWFRHLPNIDSRFLVAIPNEGKRTMVTAQRMRAEGMVAGVSDLILFDPKGEKLPLFLECKLPKGKQSESQKDFELTVIKASYRYIIFRTVDEFIQIVTDFLELPVNEFQQRLKAYKKRQQEEESTSVKRPFVSGRGVTPTRPRRY